MLWALVEFAEGCAKRASIYAADASTAAYVAAYSASISAAADAADASTAADAADASTAAYAACASAYAYAAAYAADITKYERGWQESTLLLWAECAAMDGYCERELKKGGA